MTHKPAEMPTGEIPPLTTGMRMDRETFHRVYCLHPEIRKADLIDGVVYLGGATCGVHSDTYSFWASEFDEWRDEAETGLGGWLTVIMDDTTEVQPDLVMFRTPESGGQIRYSPERYLIGAPELIVEVSVRTEELDRGPRLQAYKRNGVRECIVHSPLFDWIDWYILRGDRYELLMPDESGVVHSEAFRGLRIDVEAARTRTRETIRKCQIWAGIDERDAQNHLEWLRALPISPPSIARTG